MYDNLSGPIHTHGTVIVRVDGVDHWVDSSMLTERVLPLVPGDRDPRRRSGPRDAGRAGRRRCWRVWWTHPFLDEKIGCLLLDDDVTAEHYLARYEWSRGLSPFNTAAVRDAQRRRSPASRWRSAAASSGAPAAPRRAELGDDRDRVLIEEFGYSEAIVARLPPDDPPADRE